jgi:hypothetical protein
MTTSPQTHRLALPRLLFVALTAVTCCGLLAGAALAPAPPVVLVPLIVLCVGLPMAVTSELRGAVAGLRDLRDLDRLRRRLAALPEVEHPLGL